MSRRLEFLEAVKSGDLAKVSALLAVDPNLINQREEYYHATPLHYAAQRGHQSMAETLIEKGADLNSRDGTWGATPAGWAIEYLVEKGALLGYQIDDFIHAIKTEQVEWVRRFLERHPHLAKSQDKAGTALKHAIEIGNAEIVELLKRYQG